MRCPGRLVDLADREGGTQGPEEGEKTEGEGGGE
jgi:hypothetical protein